MKPHDTLSGPATQKILYREFHEFADAKNEALCAISVAHIYNLRKRREYRERRRNFEKTRPTQVSIGERRRRRGARVICESTRCIREISMGSKVVYHINAVDEVTQWQVVGATEKISEAWLQPVPASILEQFPFRRMER